MDPVSLQVDVHVESGALNITAQGHYIHQATSLIRYQENGTDHTLDLIKGGAIRSYSTDSNGSRCHSIEVSQIKDGLSTLLAFRRVDGEPFIEVSARVELLEEARQVRVDSIELMRFSVENTFLKATGMDRCRFWGDWHDIWHAVGSRPLSGERISGDIETASAYHAASIYNRDTHEGITCLYRLPNQWLDVLTQEDLSLVARNRIGAVLEPRRPLNSDRLLITLGLPFTEALPKMHRNHAPRRRASESRNHFGWNSWEAYRSKVTEEAIVENLDGMNRIPWMKERIKYVTIDDGWQRCYGDWVPNGQFPNGMDGMARKIREAGFTPGIWSAPFLVDSQSELCRKHADWFLQTTQGPYVDSIGKRYVLDPTNPGTPTYLFQLYRQFHTWGYRYYKTDFLRDAMMVCVPERPEYRTDIRLHDSQLGIARGMRCCMEAIRAGMGEDSFWLGCGTDIGSGSGLMDASRSGGDVVPYWTRVPNQARSVINHFHLHGNLFLVDPDFCIVKGSETFEREYLDIPLVSDKPYLVDEFEGGNCFSADDARTWATLVILSGGLLNLTDRIKGLNKTGLSILRTAMHYAGGAAAVPIDIENSIPHILLAEREEYYLLGIVNWGHHNSLSVSLDSKSGIPFPTDGCLHEIWTGGELKLPAGKHEVKLQPHKAHLYTWKKS